MSSLFRSSVTGRVIPARIGPVAVVWALIGSTAGAADVYYQPIVSVATSANTNVDLDRTTRTFAEGYFADAATLIGIATPTSETTLMPRLLYNYYPTQTNLNRLEGFLSLNSRYSWRRDRLNITGFYDHRDDFNAEQPSADFNPVTPGVGGTTPTTGHIAFGTTRNYVVLDPTYSHLITPLSSIGVAAEYQRLSYSPDDTTSHVDYNYYRGRAFYAWTISPRADAAIGGFASKYIASNIDSQSTSGGAQFDLGYNWTQAIHSDLSVLAQQTKLDETAPRIVSATSHPWGATLSTIYTGQTASYRVVVGRSIAPSAAGGLFRTDQIRGQYDRDFTERLHFTGAVRYFRNRTFVGIQGNDTRDYATTTLKLQWMMTRRLFISGSYAYIWQKYQIDPSGADTNILSLQVGYRGLGRQR